MNDVKVKSVVHIALCNSLPEYIAQLGFSQSLFYDAKNDCCQMTHFLTHLCFCPMQLQADEHLCKWIQRHLAFAAEQNIRRRRMPPSQVQSSVQSCMARSISFDFKQGNSEGRRTMITTTRRRHSKGGTLRWLE